MVAMHRESVSSADGESYFVISSRGHTLQIKTQPPPFDVKDWINYSSLLLIVDLLYTRSGEEPTTIEHRESS